MEGILGSAIVQETISRVSSVIFTKHEEKACRKQSIERLEMAHTELELAIERSGKLPITDVSLLRRRKILKRAFKECGDVLHSCKLQAQEDEEIKRGVKPTDSCFPKRIARATKSYLLTMGKDDLSCSNVRRFRWLADCANRFVRDVESGCSLRHHTFCNPLVRHLLQGKTLKHEMDQGSKFHYFHLWPICFEERGVEAQVHHSYVDHETSEKSFGTTLLLRLSESTDIVGIAIECLHSLSEEQLESCATEIVGDNEEHIDNVSIEQVAKTAQSNAIKCFLSQPELTGYGMLWRSKHGSASFIVQKRNSERADWPKTQCWYRTQKKYKEKALEEKAAYLCYPNSQHKLLCLKKLVAKS